jgi:hypothetical protein
VCLLPSPLLLYGWLQFLSWLYLFLLFLRLSRFNGNGFRLFLGLFRFGDFRGSGLSRLLSRSR